MRVTGAPARTRWGTRTAVWAVALALALLAVGHAEIARADGDPASDELISQNVFYPFSTSISQVEQDRLDAAVRDVRRAGIPLKVALITHPSDLGSITALYGSPQRYAAFLDTELSFQRRVSVVVVMRDGFGSQGLPSRLQHTVSAARAPAADTGPALAAATLALVRRLDGELRTGHVGRASTGGGSGGQTRTMLLIALVLAALLIGGLLLLGRRFFPPAA